MGPKKAKKKEGGKKKTKSKDKGPTIQTAEALANKEEERKRQELIMTADSMFKEASKEEVDFNEFQQQREKLNYFWIVEKKSLEDKKAELRNKERELQDLHERHQVEIKVYKQRVKHLLHEHQDEVTTLKTDLEKKFKFKSDVNSDAQQELKDDRRNLKLNLKEMELSHEDYLKTLKQAQDKKITLLRQEFERTAKELQCRYEKKRKTIRDDLEIKRKKETHAIEEQKNAHIAQLMNAHEKAFGEIKNYYNDITHNNLDLIKSLKEEVTDMKKKEAQDEKLMFEIAQENKRMSEPLKEALKDVERLRGHLVKYKMNKDELKKAKTNLLKLEEEFKSISWEHEVYEQRLAHSKRERDELYSEFQNSIYDVQQKSGFKNLLLEKKLESMDQAVEKKEAQLNEVLSHAQLDPTILGQVRSRLEDIFESKDQSVRDLDLELHRVKQAHADMVQATKDKLMDYGIPFEEIGFNPSILVDAQT